MFERVYDNRMSGAVVVIQLVRGNDAGGVPCRLNPQQRSGQACVVCAKDEPPDGNRAPIGYVAGQSVFVHRYCIGPWQAGAVRVR